MIAVIGGILMRPRIVSLGLLVSGALLASALVCGLAAPVRPVAAALEEGGGRAQVIIGPDDDTLLNPLIQPASAFGNQSLNAMDLLIGAGGADVLIGRVGDDRLLGGPGGDILVGGPDVISLDGRDLLLGEAGDDVAIWAPNDKNDAFLGGPGRDAIVVGRLATDTDELPALSGQTPGFPRGVPAADPRALSGTCTLDRAPVPSGLGYDWLLRITIVRTAASPDGAAAGPVEATVTERATVRLADVEQVICPGSTGGRIAYADLTTPEPRFVTVAPERARQLNPLVGAIIR
jgi:hypothetical protein